MDVTKKIWGEPTSAYWFHVIKTKHSLWYKPIFFNDLKKYNNNPIQYVRQYINSLISYVLIFKDKWNMGYNMMSQLLEEKVQIINVYWRKKEKTYKYIPDQIDNSHQIQISRKIQLNIYSLM